MAVEKSLIQEYVDKRGAMVEGSEFEVGTRAAYAFVRNITPVGELHLPHQDIVPPQPISHPSPMEECLERRREEVARNRFEVGDRVADEMIRLITPLSSPRVGQEGIVSHGLGQLDPDNDWPMTPEA